MQQTSGKKKILTLKALNPGFMHFCRPPCSTPGLRFLFAATLLSTQLAFTSQVSGHFPYSSAKVRMEIQEAPTIGYEIFLHPVSCIRIIQALSLIPSAWVCIVGPRIHCHCQMSIAIHMLPTDPQVTPGTWPLPQSCPTDAERAQG